jgi:glycosyltransferase involved in cell wall biosynthesis
MAAEGFRRDGIDVVYNGIEPGPPDNTLARQERRAQLGISAEQFVVGTVARLDAVKDLGTLLQAAALMRAESAIHVVIIGDGPERTALEHESEKLDLGNRVRFLGRRDDAREWLWACDAYVNCSISEGVSLTILEAMAASLPIVATRVGGTPEVVDETCARLVPARNPTAVAEAIVAFFHDPNGRQSFGRRARQRLEERFTIDRMVNEYASTYQCATAGRRRRNTG